MKKLKFYMVEFEKNDIIKKKIYLFDCIVHSSNYCTIIIITYIFGKQWYSKSLNTKKGYIFMI